MKCEQRDLADQCVPDGLAWTAHAHGQRQQGKFRSRLRELGEQQLVAAHTRVVIHIAGLRHAHHGMNQQVSPRLAWQRGMPVRRGPDAWDYASGTPLRGASPREQTPPELRLEST